MTVKILAERDFYKEQLNAVKSENEQLKGALKQLINIYHTIGPDGELTAPVLEIIQAWLYARDLVNKTG